MKRIHNLQCCVHNNDNGEYDDTDDDDDDDYVGDDDDDDESHVGGCSCCQRSSDFELLLETSDHYNLFLIIIRILNHHDIKISMTMMDFV